MKFLLLWVISSSQQIFTTTNTCSNEKSIFKIDIRDRVKQLGSGFSIEDLDADSLCLEAYNYDFIWLQQLWTPSQYNYRNEEGVPKGTDDYRELLNIKEYFIDPSLGTLTNLYQFQKKVKNQCPHILFLGEFSFHIGQDSYLMQNSSRFLKRPLLSNPNIYDSRYDNENFIWAFNDQFKALPHTAVWNYFNINAIRDLKDLIYKQYYNLTIQMEQSFCSLVSDYMKLHNNSMGLKLQIKGHLHSCLISITTSVFIWIISNISLWEEMTHSKGKNNY